MNARGRVVRNEVERRFGVPIHEGFDDITEPANWPAYWPRFARLDRESRWRAPGDHARITLRMLARERTAMKAATRRPSEGLTRWMP